MGKSVLKKRFLTIERLRNYSFNTLKRGKYIYYLEESIFIYTKLSVKSISITIISK